MGTPRARWVLLTTVLSVPVLAGVAGYVVKHTDPETIVDALRTVAAGGIVLGPSLGPALVGAMNPTPDRLPPPFDRLTERELTIVRHLVRESTNAAIARRVGVSEKTIRNQLSAIFTKLGVSDRTQAALRARDAHLA